MNIILIIMTASLFGIGLFFILADALRVPTYASSKAANELGKRRHPKTNPIEIWLRDLSHFIAGKIKLGDYRKAQLSADLTTADMDITPEEYIANAITKALFIGIFSVPMFFLFKFGALLLVIFAVVVYFKESRSIVGRLKVRRQKIEYELPRFVGFVEKTLKHSRDVLYMIESYRDNAGPELRREIEITIADMRSGNMEAALTRLESRVGSSMMSDLTRGLIGIIRGDDTVVYWASLNMKFSDYQRQLLKNEARAVPRKVRRLSLILLICFMAIYIVVIGQVLFDSLSLIL